MSKKATKMFTLWFLFVLCFVPALFLTATTLWILDGPQYEAVAAQVVSMDGGTVRVQYDSEYGSRMGELADPDKAAGWQVGSAVTVYNVYGHGIYADRGSAMPMTRLGELLCLAFWLASITLLIAAVTCTVKSKPRQKSPRPAKVSAPPRPAFDPERKR